MRTSTIFDIRSITKEITATALMCLVEDSRLSLEDAVSTYLPEFASLKVAIPGQPPRSPSRPVTLLDLLTETAGWHRCILNSESVSTMLQPRVPTSIDGISQGLAWFICTNPSKQSELRLTKGSFGAAGASGTFGWIDPDRQLIRLLLMQRFGGTDAERNTFMYLADEVSYLTTNAAAQSSRVSSSVRLC